MYKYLSIDSLSPHHVKMSGMGEFIRDRREEQGMSQKRLAQLVGTSPAYMSQIEKGKPEIPGIELRRKIAEAIGVTHLDLLVAAGVIGAHEIPKEGEPKPLVADSDPRRPMIDAILALQVDGPRDVYSVVAGMLAVVPMEIIRAKESSR